MNAPDIGIAQHIKPIALHLLGTPNDRLSSLLRVLDTAGAATVIASGTATPAYGRLSVTAALTRKTALIVETRIEREQAWVSLIQRRRPTLPLLISTVKAGHA